MVNNIATIIQRLATCIADINDWLWADYDSLSQRRKLCASKSNAVNVQWITSHVGLEGNTRPDLEAKWGSTLSQNAAAIDCTTACMLLATHICGSLKHITIAIRTHEFITIPGSDLSHCHWQRLVQTPAHHYGTASYWPLSSTGVLHPSYWVSELPLHISTATVHLSDFAMPNRLPHEMCPNLQILSNPGCL